MSGETSPTLEAICSQLLREYPRAVVFIGEPVFRDGDHSRSLLSRLASGLARTRRFDDIPVLAVPVSVPDRTDDMEVPRTWKAH